MFDDSTPVADGACPLAPNNGGVSRSAARAFGRKTFSAISLISSIALSGVITCLPEAVLQLPFIIPRGLTEGARKTCFSEPKHATKLPDRTLAGYTVRMARILLHTLGSSGDFNPFIAIALELKKRGHQPCFAVQPAHVKPLQALGLEAVGAGQDVDPQSDLYRRLLQPSLTEPIDVLFREMLIPAIQPATELLTPLVKECDLFLTHTKQLAAPAVA